jgi:hypothetical protein
MTYQWKKDGHTISETTARYVIDSAKSSDAGSYTVTVTNSLGSATSDVAILTDKNNSTAAKKKSGCGSGAGLAFIPPLFFKAMSYRKRKKKNPKN